MALNKNQIVALYRKRAANYDFSANLYYLIGFREFKYRKLAVQKLQLKQGSTVVEIGCGTGLNFPLLVHSVGHEGKVIGVDLTDKMLAMARARVAKNEWANVELVQADAAGYAFPDNVNGIISTFAITLIPEFEEIMRRGAEALAPQGRMVIADLRKPWEAMERYLTDTGIIKLYGGFTYISWGEKS